MSRSNSNPEHYKVTLTRLNSKSPEEELLDLCNLSGVTLDPDVFKIVMDLIKMNVQPTALVQVLKKITTSSKTSRADTSRNSVSDEGPSKPSLTKPDKNGAVDTRPERRERSKALSISSRSNELKSHTVHS